MLYMIKSEDANLHSNMVRFIIQPPSVYVDRIPNLHSNMVRFIIA